MTQEGLHLSKDHVHYRGQRYEVIDRIVLGRKKYLITRQLSAQIRRRFLAFDPIAGPKGALRILQFMPRSQEAWKRVGVLQQLSKNNPELPQILEFHRQGGEIAIVQPWIEGRDLTWWIQQMQKKGRQRIGTPEALRMFRGMAHALHRFHRRCNIVHADIKPANIIVSTEGRRMTLIDFGSAWQVEQTTSRNEGDGQTQHYAAPEILAGSTRVDFRADHFSLAAVCFEVLTLELPYDGLGGNAGQFADNDESESLYIPPSKLSPEADKIPKSAWSSIDHLFEKALQLDPDDRFADSRQWLDAWNDVTSQSLESPKLNAINRWIIRCLDWFSRGQKR